MDQFSLLLGQGAAQAWWFLPTALGIGALHGLEPGHSKSLMAAFIIAVRGTWQQAMVLGLCVALSHSLVVWLIAGVGLYFGPEAQALLSEQRLGRISGVLVLAVALWMLWNMLRARAAKTASDDHHDHHDHHVYHAQCHHHSSRQLVGGSRTNLSAHDLAHARDIQHRFGNGRASWGQIVLFGLSGGLIPCPASIAVLALCLQAQQVVIGFALVAAFSLGLALALMSTGLVAAWGVKHASARAPWLNQLSVLAPWMSVAILCVLGVMLLGS